MIYVNITFSSNKSKISLQILFYFLFFKTNGVQTSQPKTIRNTSTIKTFQHSPQLKCDIVLNVQKIWILVNESARGKERKHIMLWWTPQAISCKMVRNPKQKQNKNTNKRK